MVGAAGLEPATLGLEIRCSIRLSYAPINPFYLAVEARQPHCNSQVASGSRFVSQEGIAYLRKLSGNWKGVPELKANSFNRVALSQSLPKSRAPGGTLAAPAFLSVSVCGLSIALNRVSAPFPPASERTY